MASLLNFLGSTQKKPQDNLLQGSTVNLQQAQPVQLQSAPQATLSLSKPQQTLSIAQPVQQPQMTITRQPAQQQIKPAFNVPSFQSLTIAQQAMTPERIRQNKMYQGFKQGQSFEDIAKNSGNSMQEIQKYKDTMFPTYGDKGVIGNIANGMGDLAKGMWNGGKGLVTRPFTDVTDLNRQKGESELQQINKDFQSGAISPDAAMERANTLASKYTTQKAYQDKNGWIRVGNQNVGEFAGNIAQQGLDTSNLLPVAGGVLSGAAKVAQMGGKTVLANALGKGAGLLTGGTTSLATSKLAQNLASRGMNSETARIVGNAITSNAKQAAMYGTLQTGSDVLNGRGVTPESLAANYGGTFAMGVLPDIGIPMAARGIKTGVDAIPTAHKTAIAHPLVQEAAMVAKDKIARRQALLDSGVSPNNPQVVYLTKGIAADAAEYNRVYKRVVEQAQGQLEGGFQQVPFGKKPDAPLNHKSVDPTAALKQEAKPYVVPKSNPTDVTKMTDEQLGFFAKQGYTSITDKYGNTRQMIPTKSDGIKRLDSLNPTGGVLVDYNPQERVTMPLADNMTTLDKTSGRPSNEMVTIYRGAPKNQTSINPGDFVTTNRELAKSYTGDGNILESKVPMSHVLDDKTSPLGEEYIYRPTNQAHTPQPKPEVAQGKVEAPQVTKTLQTAGAKTSELAARANEVLTPNETKVSDFAHSYAAENTPDAILKEAVDMAHSFDKQAKGGQLVSTNSASDPYSGNAGVSRISEHSDFYRKYFKETGHAPSKAAFQAEVQKQLESGRAGSLVDQDQVGAYQLAKDNQVPAHAMQDTTDYSLAFQNDLQKAGLVPTAQTTKQGVSVKSLSQSIPQEKGNTSLLRTNQNPQSATLLNGRKQTGISRTSSKAQQTKSLGSQNPISSASDQTPTNTRTRGFIETIVNDPTTDSHIKDSLSSVYQVRNTKELQQKASTFVKEHPSAAKAIANNVEDDKSLAIASAHWAKQQTKANQLLSKGDTLGGNAIYDEVLAQQAKAAEALTKAGQFAQAASVYGKTTPEGILRFAQNEIKRYNESANLSPDKQVKLSTQQAADLTESARKVQAMPDGRLKDIETQKVVNKVKELLPVSWVKKVSTLQTMGQLLNPKTAIRNILGNTLFGGVENISQTIAAGIDKATSAITHSQRTTALPNLKTQAKGMYTHGKEAVQEVAHGVNLGPDTQFELKQVPVFKSKFMRGVEKTMGMELQVPDRAAYGAAYDDTVQGLMKANKLTKPTQAIIEQANANGLYKTFQDNSKAAQLFSGLKQALNHVGVTGKDGAKFGLGDFILKYPKTPGNILARGLDYSPVGILKGLYQIVKPAISKQPFDQHTFSNSIARGVVGTGGIMGAGVVLGALGIITEKPSQDTDTRNLQKASGQGGYQINVDAIRRLFGSGFNGDAAKLQQGDTLVSYDWAQPMSIPLSAGAAIGKGQSAADGAINTVGNFAEGLNTLVEQPLLTGVNTLANNIKNKGVIGALGEAAKGAPASFVPTASNQVRQLTDNTTRNTYDPNPWDQTLNMVKNKIPGLANDLQPSVDTLGNPKENYQNGSNNIFNVAVNPAFVNKYQPNSAAKLPLDMLNNSGETQQMPRTTATTQNINGQSLKLTPQQNHDFQQYVGQKTTEYYNQLQNNPTFMAKPDSEKASIMNNGLSDIYKAGKTVILGDTGKMTAAQTSIANGGDTFKTSMGSVSTDPKTRYQTNLANYNQALKDGTISGAKALATKQSLDKEAVTSQYPQEVLDFYGLSNANKSAYFKQDPAKAQQLYDQAKQLDAKLVGTGLSTTKFKATTASSKSSSKKTSTKTSRLAETSAKIAATKKAHAIKVPTVKAYTGSTKSKMPTSKLAKTALKKYQVKSKTA